MLKLLGQTMLKQSENWIYVGRTHVDLNCFSLLESIFGLLLNEKHAVSLRHPLRLKDLRMLIMIPRLLMLYLCSGYCWNL